MYVDFIAGLLGGSAGVIVGHPFDTIKVHIQTDNHKNPKYKGMWHCFKTILLDDNVRGLYRGIGSPMMSISLIYGILFGVYGNVLQLSNDPNALMSHFWAGAVAGFAQSFVCAPMELAKTRLQLLTQNKGGRKFKGTIDCLIYTHRTEGFRGLFKGFTATVVRDIPSYGAFFVSYEYLMRLKETHSVPYSLMAGGVAGMNSCLISYPIDVVKTQIEADGIGRSPKFSGLIDCSIKIYEREGIPVFFRGLNSIMVQAFPMNAACFFVVTAVFDISKKYG